MSFASRFVRNSRFRIYLGQPYYTYEEVKDDDGVVRLDAEQKPILRATEHEAFDDSEDWIEIPADLPTRVQENIQRASLKAKMASVDEGGRTTQAALEWSFADSRRVLREECIVGWSFVDEYGNPEPPPTKALIGDMSAPLSNWLADAIDAHYASLRRSEADKRKAHDGVADRPAAGRTRGHRSNASDSAVPSDGHNEHSGVGSVAN